GAAVAGRQFFFFYFIFGFFIPCGRYNMTARNNRLSRAVLPPARENTDFHRQRCAGGPNDRTEK
ncbi:Os06g0344201, partial [Oryza sativa Japonica Group]